DRLCAGWRRQARREAPRQHIVAPGAHLISARAGSVLTDPDRKLVRAAGRAGGVPDERRIRAVWLDHRPGTSARAAPELKFRAGTSAGGGDEVEPGPAREPPGKRADRG